MALLLFSLLSDYTYNMKTYYSQSLRETDKKSGLKYIFKYLHKSFLSLLIFIFLTTQICLCFPKKAQAQSMFHLPAPGTMVTSTPNFIPAMIKGIKIFPDNPLRFDFLIDTGHTQFEDKMLETESSKLIKYFLASLTVPEDEIWVNLSPYEKNRIIPEKFGVTEMGRDLLGQDYILKQLTASLLYPEDDLGENFWNRVYQKANQLYGTSDISVNTFNKVWIVPKKALIYENGDIAVIVESDLKVMLEADYLTLIKNLNTTETDMSWVTQQEAKEASNISSKIIKEIIVPEIEKEVNEGANFALLRQIYHSMILATWFKRNLKKSLLGQVYLGKNKVSGVDIEDKEISKKIYNRYLESFKIGVYNYIKEDYDPVTKELVPRKYFSGGVDFGEEMDPAMVVEKHTKKDISKKIKKEAEGSLKTASAYLKTVNNFEKTSLPYTSKKFKGETPTVKKKNLSSIDQIINVISRNGKRVNINGANIDIDQELLGEYKAFGFNSEEEFLKELKDIFAELLNIYKPGTSQFTIALLDEADYQQTDDFSHGFIGIHRHLIERLKTAPKTALALLYHGLERRIIQEAHYIERLVLIDHFRETEEISFQEAISKAEEFLNTYGSDLVSEMQQRELLKQIFERTLEEDLNNAQLMGLDVKKILVEGVLRPDDDFASRYVRENRSAYGKFIRNEIETGQLRFGFVEESDPVYSELNEIFQKVRKASLQDEDIKLHVINSDDITAYWMIDSDDFFISLGLIKSFKNFLKEKKGKTLTLDHIAWIFAHELRHRWQYIEKRDDIPEEESKKQRTMQQNKEYDADTGGLFLSAFAGFNAGASADALEFLDNIGYDIPFMGTHPKSDNRLGEVQKILQSPDIALPNMNKEYQEFSETFLNSPLINNATESALFHQQLLESRSLDELMTQLDQINDPVKLEEFVMHYYFRMLYDFSSGVVQSQSFQEYFSFVLTANNIDAYLERWITASISSYASLETFTRDWDIPVDISKLFQYFHSQGPGAKIPKISALGREIGLPRWKIENALLQKIQGEIDRLDKGGATTEKDKSAVINALNAMKSALEDILDESINRDLARAQNIGDKVVSATNQVFSSLEEAQRQIGDELIINASERNDGSYFVTYLTTEDMLENMEKFWEFFDEQYDRSRRETRDRQKKAASQIDMLGLKDWMKKRYGRLELPPLVADIGSNARGFIRPTDTEKRQAIEKGRAEFFPLYMRALAFYFLNQRVGAFGESKNKNFPINDDHFKKLKTKFLETSRKQFAQSKLDEKAIELLSLIHYMSIFRGFNETIDSRVETLIAELDENQMKIILDILVESPALYMTTMPENVQNMLKLDDFYPSFQKNFASYSYQILSKILTQKAQVQEIDITDLGRVMQLKQTLEVRLEGNISQSKQFNALVKFIASEILKTRSSDASELLLIDIARYQDNELTQAFLRYIFNDYFSKNDYQPKINILTRLNLKASKERNDKIEKLFKSVNYEGMNDERKEDFLENLLPLFKTNEDVLSVPEPEKRPLHQILSKDYMELLKKKNMQIPKMIRKMDAVGAVVTQFDLITANQREWKNTTFNEMREIISIIKNSKNGYKKYHFALGTIALSKLKSGIPTFTLSSTTSISVNREDSTGHTEMVYLYTEAMSNSADFQKYFSKLIIGTDAIFEDMIFEESIALVLEFLPNGRERDEILFQLLPSDLTEAQAIGLVKEFVALEDHGELAELGLPPSSWDSGSRPTVEAGMMFAYLGMEWLDSINELDKLNADSVIMIIRTKFSDAKDIDLKEADKELILLKNKIEHSVHEYKQLIAIDGPRAFGALGYINTVKGDVMAFATSHLIRGNPHFDYYNLKNFGYQYSKDKLRFSVFWRVYQAQRKFLKNDSIFFKEKIKKILQFFPEKTSLRNNELDWLIAMEEAYILGTEPALIEQQLNFIGLEHDPYEVVANRNLDLKRLNVQQAKYLIDIYKSLIPLMSGTHQITLGRKIFEMQKKFFPEIYSDFTGGLKEILLIFPKFSLARDSVLNEFINMGSVKVYPQLLEVNNYILEQQRLTKEKDIVDDAMWNELWNSANKLPSRKEKADFILWMLSPDSRPMPESMHKLSIHNHVNFDSLPTVIFGLTKGERDKFFYDFLRGYNGLFDVNSFKSDEIQSIIEKVLFQRTETITEILSKNKKADQNKILTAFDELENNQTLEHLAKLLAVIEKEGGSKLKQAAKKVLSAGAFGPILEKIAALDMGKIIDNKDVILSAISDLDNLQQSLEDLKGLVRVSSHLGIGKTLNQNLERLREISQNKKDLQPLISDISQALENFKGIDFTDINKIISQISKLKGQLEILNEIKTKTESQSDSIQFVYNEMKKVALDLDAMKSELKTLMKLTRILEKIALFSGTSAKFQQIDKMLDLTEDKQLREVIGQIQLLVEQNFNGENLSPVEYIQTIELDVENNQQLSRFVDQLFYNVFQPGELGNAEDILKDIFDSIFNGYSTERRILLFNSLLDIFADEELRNKGRAKKVRAILEQIGVIGVKVAQYLSEQPQLFVGSEDILIELRNLKKDASSFHNKALFQLVQEDGLSDVIVEIQDQMAAASVKQVNKVLLNNGTIAAGKFLRPSAEKFLKEDLLVVDQTLRMLNVKYPHIGLPVDMREDLEKMILEELRFALEAENVKRYRQNLSQRQTTFRNGFQFKAPKIFYQTKNIIIEELVNGITLDDLILVKTNDADLSAEEIRKKKKIQHHLQKNFTHEEKEKLLSFDVEEIQDAVIQDFFTQAFREGFYHADLHYGNIMVTPKSELYLIDFGASGKIDAHNQQPLLNLLIAINSKDSHWGISLINRFLHVPVAKKKGTKQKLKTEIESNNPIDVKLKNIIKIIKENQLGASDQLMVYLKGLSAVSPMFDSLSESQKKGLVSSHLTTKSKIGVGTRILKRKLNPLNIISLIRSSNLIGKLFDQRGKIVSDMNVNVVRKGAAYFVQLTSEDGNPLFDKEGNEVKAFKVGEKKISASRKESLLKNIRKKFQATWKNLSEEERKIVQGVISYIEEMDIYLLSKPGYGIGGLPVSHDKVGGLHIVEGLLDEITIFHEGVEVFFKKEDSKELLQWVEAQGLSPHTLARGSGKNERKNNPNYRLGLQDKLFGERANERQTQKIENENLGGINLDPNLLNMQTQGKGINFNIPTNLQNIGTIELDGFSPVILQIISTHLPVFMDM